MSEKLRFLEEWLAGKRSRTELCAAYGISRKSAYALWARFRREGMEAAGERPRRPVRCPHRTPPAVEARVTELRREHPTWGPKKLAALMESESDVRPPAPSTIALILRRQGLSRPQRRRRHEVPFSPALVEAQAPNEVWSTDFKGCFHVGTGERCDPLTVMDLHSRFLLACHGYFLHEGRLRFEEVREVYEELFRCQGVPRFILSDNGGPFVSTCPGGLTRLTVFWIRLGITPLRIASGKPQENGRLERLHRTLKAEVASPPARTVAEQRERLAAFRSEYNERRPHEALGMAVPAAGYRPGAPWDGLIPDPVFPAQAIVRRVTRAGGLKWKNRMYTMPMPLCGEELGLVPVDSGWELVELHLGHYCVGVLNLASGKILAAPRDAQLLSQPPHPPQAVREITA